MVMLAVQRREHVESLEARLKVLSEEVMVMQKFMNEEVTVAGSQVKRQDSRNPQVMDIYLVRHHV